MPIEPVVLEVWSDYLCPWCYNAAVRLRRVERESTGRVRIAWQAFLLRPRPDPSRTLDEFRTYTRSWKRPAADPDGGTFSVWASDAGPPSHSVPPHLVAKAAAILGEDAFYAIHERLLRAYFAENRDITDVGTLRAVWGEAGLPVAEFERSEDPAILRRVLDEHGAAVAAGVSGVPTVRVRGADVWVPGALPLESYRRWVARLI